MNILKNTCPRACLAGFLVLAVFLTFFTNASLAKQPAGAKKVQDPDVKVQDPDVKKVKRAIRKVPPYYVIGPSDVLEVAVWREDALSRTDVLVRPDGRLSMPLLDDVMAAGRTPMQLKLIIAKKLKQFVEAPKVYITVANPRSHYFAVMGNVAKPGYYPMLTPTTVLQALAKAEGFNEWADKDDTVVLRGVGTEQKRHPFEYSEVISGEKLEQNILLEPGDVVLVP